MPIEINYTNGAPWGPGFFTVLRSNDPSMQGVPAKWILHLFPDVEATSGSAMGEYDVPDASLPFGFLSGYTHPTWNLTFGTPQIRHGASNALKIQLVTEGGLADTLTVPITTDLITGQQVITQNLVGQGQTGGGLTPTQAEQLTQIQMAVGWQVGGGVTDALFDLINTVGPRLLGSSLIGDFSGEGTLPSTPGPFPGVNHFGVAWMLIDKPEGVGLDEGNPDRVEIEYLQLSEMVSRGAAGVVCRASSAEQVVNGTRLWLLDYPFRVDFYILPGATVRFWWI